MQWLKKYTIISIVIFSVPALMVLYQNSCAWQPSVADPAPFEEQVTIFKGNVPEQDSKRQQHITQAIHTHNQSLLHSDSPFKGPQNSNIALVIFFDYQCSHCKRVAPILEALQNNDHALKIIYKEFPILGDTSIYAAKAALAAQRQGKYDLFGTQLMQTEQLSKNEILKIAENSGLNVDQLKIDIDSDEMDNKIAHNVTLAKELTIKSTPAIFLVHEQPGNKLNPISHAFFITGNAELETLQELIHKLREN